MNDQNLADLIIENIEPKSSKSKSLITILALMVVLLIITIVLTKIIIKSPNEEIIFEEENTEFISPELTLKETIATENIKPPIEKLEPKLFNREDIVKDLNKTEEEIIVKNNGFVKVEANPLTEKNKTKIEIIRQPIIFDKPKEIVEAIKENVVEKKPITIKKVEKKIEKKPTPRKKVEKKIEKKPTPRKKVVKKVKKKVVKKSTQRKKVPKKIVKNSFKNVHPKGRYYIQVGSFSRSPNKKFLNIIKKANYNYKIVSTRDGSKKLLIGPYSTNSAVRLVLPKIRDRINKSAFIYKK